MRDRGTAHRLRCGIAPGDPADIVQVVNPDLPGMDPELQQERQEGGDQALAEAAGSNCPISDSPGTSLFRAPSNPCRAGRLGGIAG